MAAHAALSEPLLGQTDFFSVLGNALKTFDVVGASFGPLGWLNAEALDDIDGELQTWGFYVRSSQLSASVGLETFSGFEATEPSLALRGGLRVLPSVTARVHSHSFGQRRCGIGVQCPFYAYLSVHAGAAQLWNIRTTISTPEELKPVKANGSGFTVGPIVGFEFPLGSPGGMPSGAFLEYLPRYHNFPSMQWTSGGADFAPPPSWPLSMTGWTHTIRVGFAVSVTRPPSASPPPPTILSASPLPTGTVGVPYNHRLSAAGGDGGYTWRLEGQVPAGLQVTSRGIIEGTPTRAGSSTLTMSLSSAGHTVQKTFFIEIEAGAAVAPVISTTALPAAMVGTAYSVQLQASGGAGGYTWSRTNTSPDLPSGLRLTERGQIVGTPEASGEVDLRFTITSGVISTLKTLRLRILPRSGSVPIVQTTSLPEGTVGAEYSSQLSASGGSGPYGWSVVSTSPRLPDGLQLTEGGLLEGTPTVAGTTVLEVAVRSGPNAGVATLTLVIR